MYFGTNSSFFNKEKIRTRKLNLFSLPNKHYQIYSILSSYPFQYFTTYYVLSTWKRPIWTEFICICSLVPAIYSNFTYISLTCLWIWFASFSLYHLQRSKLIEKFKCKRNVGIQYELAENFSFNFSHERSILYLSGCKLNVILL